LFTNSLISFGMQGSFGHSRKMLHSSATVTLWRQHLTEMLKQTLPVEAGRGSPAFGETVRTDAISTARFSARGPGMLILKS
jgi:hypothetical protein